MNAEPRLNRLRQVWVGSGVASYAGHTVVPKRHLLSSCPGWSSVPVCMRRYEAQSVQEVGSGAGRAGSVFVEPAGV